jgi:putative ABC transport system ATP-binding protein
LPTLFGSDYAKAWADERAARLLDTAGLSDKRHVYPRQLSAGQQQRVVIARSLMNQPALLLADEPTGNLDEKTEREVMNLFREIHVTTDVTILLLTHTSQLASYGTRPLEMAGGFLCAGSSVAMSRGSRGAIPSEGRS